MGSCKILALYLPQFHRIPENDKWWGEGFTEWSIVKNAQKVTNYSNQPREPLHGYYDLSDMKSIRRQAELAQKYCIDGFVIYSYYSNGQKLLEKPSEILLNQKDIDISFCFSWANHDWKRTWFAYNTEMLRSQEYANNDEQIIEHFMYLLPYFQDERYIKFNNKPVFFIYDYKKIPNFSRYKQVWNEYAIKFGFYGIYFVQTLGGNTLVWNGEIFDACFDFEPTYTTFSSLKFGNLVNKVRRKVKYIFKTKWIGTLFDYNEVCNVIEKRKCEDPNHLLGIFAEWDNTPRHVDNGVVFKNFSIEAFRKCFMAQLKKSKQYNKPFLIIDAWNEWGEGAFLEPDNIYRFQKLEVIKGCVDSLNCN